MTFRLVYMILTLPILSYTTAPTHVSVVVKNNSKTTNTHNQTLTHAVDVQQAPVVTNHSPPILSPTFLTTQPAYAPSWKEYIIAHPSIVTGALITGTYILVFSSLYSLSYLCNNHCPWAHWHENISVKQLQKIPVQEKTTALISCITRVYQGNNTAICQPLLHFVNDLNTELSWHNSFLTLYNCLQATGLSLLFPLPQSQAKKIAEQKERLMELCTTLNSLCSLQNVKQYDTEPTL